MCLVPTLTFDLLFAFLVLGHGRRQLLWFEVTRHSTAEWLARQIILPRRSLNLGATLPGARLRPRLRTRLYVSATDRSLLSPRACIEPSNTLAPLSPYRSWLGCTITSGYDFRKGQVLLRQRFRRAVKQRPRRTRMPRRRLGCLLNARGTRHWLSYFRRLLPTVGGSRRIALVYRPQKAHL